MALELGASYDQVRERLYKSTSFDQSHQRAVGANRAACFDPALASR